MRAGGVSELGHVPFVRHQLDPALIRGAWVRGDAAVVVSDRIVNEGRVTVVGFGDTDVTGLLAASMTRSDARIGSWSPRRPRRSRNGGH